MAALTVDLHEYEKMPKHIEERLVAHFASTETTGTIPLMLKNVHSLVIEGLGPEQVYASGTLTGGMYVITGGTLGLTRSAGTTSALPFFVLAKGT